MSLATRKTDPEITWASIMGTFVYSARMPFRVDQMTIGSSLASMGRRKITQTVVTVGEPDIQQLFNSTDEQCAAIMIWLASSGRKEIKKAVYADGMRAFDEHAIVLAHEGFIIQISPRGSGKDIYVKVWRAA